MPIKEYSQQLDSLMWSIESKKEKIRALESIATNTTQTLTGMPHNPSAIPSRMADAAGKIVDLESSIKNDEAKIEELKMKMCAAIDQVPEAKYRVVLNKRYIRGMTIDEIAEDILYCQRTAYRFLKTANKLLEKILAEQ